MTVADDIALLAEQARIRRAKIERLLIVIVTLIGFLALWEIVGRLSNPLFFAPVSDVLSEFWLSSWTRAVPFSADLPRRLRSWCLGL